MENGPCVQVRIQKSLVVVAGWPGQSSVEVVVSFERMRMKVVSSVFEFDAVFFTEGDAFSVDFYFVVDLIQIQRSCHFLLGDRPVFIF